MRKVVRDPSKGPIVKGKRTRKDPPQVAEMGYQSPRDRHVCNPAEIEPRNTKVGKRAEHEYLMERPPTFRGSFKGHAVYARNRRQTGTLPFETTDPVTGDPVTGRMKVFRTEHDRCWVWNGKRWVRSHAINAG